MDYPKQSPKQKIGQLAEQLACDYLTQKGLCLIAKNYRSYRGEIDLIMKDKNTLAFIEVRYRKNNLFGGALESINWHKQQRIISAAQQYLMRFRLADKWPCRFDVVIISGNLKYPDIEWIIQAFD
jgi:putative endonuclease